MRIDRKLHLVIPLTGTDGSIRTYVHSTAITSDIFEKYWLVISKTFAAIHSEGLGNVAGPRVADKLLKMTAEQLGIWKDVQTGLVAEIQRLTNVLVQGDDGWELMPFHDAKKQGLLEPEDAAEVEAAVTFFTVASSMYRREIRALMLAGAAELWGAQISSQNCTDTLTSLQTSTEAANSGAKTPA